MVMGDGTQARTVAYSTVLGLVACEIVGRNETNYLVRVFGMRKPMSIARSLVFELDETWDLDEAGRLLAPDAASGLGDPTSGEGEVREDDKSDVASDR